MNTLPRPPSGVLFDLDGTLLDSAPGVYAALETCCVETGHAPPPYAEVRAVVSRGSRAVLRTVWSDADDAQLEPHLLRFLEHYAAVMGPLSQPFAGIEPLLGALEAAGIPWGVVTNKPGFLTQPLLTTIGWWSRAASVVAGDTLPQRKPDPAPVLHACHEAGMDPHRGLFVGDDARDIEAGCAAGMTTVAAAWGYLNRDDPAKWGADHTLATPTQLAALLGLPVPA